MRSFSPDLTRIWPCIACLCLAFSLTGPDSAAAQEGTAQFGTVETARAGLLESAAILQSEARSRAADASNRPAAPPDRLDMEDPFLFELELFAADAMRLSLALAEQGGPEDLRCIFRGMSGDAEAWRRRLDSAANAGAQARAYAEINRLMAQALEIAPMASQSAGTGSDASSAPATCPAR